MGRLAAQLAASSPQRGTCGEQREAAPKRKNPPQHLGSPSQRIGALHNHPKPGLAFCTSGVHPLPFKPQATRLSGRSCCGRILLDMVFLCESSKRCSYRRWTQERDRTRERQIMLDKRNRELQNGTKLV